MNTANVATTNRLSPLWLGLALAVGLMGAGFLWHHTQDTSSPSPPIRGITLDSPRPTPPETLPELQALGVTHVTCIPYGFSRDSSSVILNADARWYSESDAGIRALAAQADSLGMDLIIKPQIWIRGGGWTADLNFATEAGWQTWETSYHRFMMHYAELAADLDAALLVIGTELANPVRTRPAFWQQLIIDIRAVYNGKLTYAANWYDDYEHVPFWEDLDYIGIQAYFPLSDAEKPTLADLQAGWAPHKDAIHSLQQRVNRPVLFTEMGYRSIHFAAAEPWVWPKRTDSTPDVDHALALQADLYEAFFQTVWHEPWVAGTIIWKWHPGIEHSRHPRTLDFTPQNKPAEDVLAAWFRQ